MARALGVSPSPLSGWKSGRDPAGETSTKHAYLQESLSSKLQERGRPSHRHHPGNSGGS
ncbi:hypothetical protein [Streptomyces sp. DSM 118878]